MAELLHYLDKMEYRPTPKPATKILLKRRPDQETHTTTDQNLLEIVDKRRVSGFKRVVIKEYERLIGSVQEKKRRDGEKKRNDGTIYVEFASESFVEEEAPIATHRSDEESPPQMPVTPLNEPKTPEDKSRELDKRLEDLAEEEPKTPEDKSKELDERLRSIPDSKREEYEYSPERLGRVGRIEESEPIARKKNKTAKKQKSDEDTGNVSESESDVEKDPFLLPKGKKDKEGKKVKEQERSEEYRVQKIDETTEIDGDLVFDRVPRPKELSQLIVKAPTYYMSNRKLYLQNIAALFRHFSKELLDDKTPVSCDKQGSTTNIDLLIHQRIVREYLNLYTPYRGLLLYHGLGSGKTCTSIAIAEAAKTHKRVFVLTPASLKMNFFSELKKCGDALYKKNQHWDFISTEGRPEYIGILSQILSIDPLPIKKRGGAWLVDIQKTEPNFKDLSPEQQKSLDEQLNDMIRAKYIDINYNGLTDRKFKELESKYADPITKNPFDHSVVLVDEAHNLVSRIVNNLGKKTSVSVKLYEYLQSAQDVRIVFMSGTPVINYPHEMAVLFNMLRGYIKTWKFTVTTGGLTADRILKLFRDANFTTYDYVDYSNSVLSITRNPFGFVNVDKKGSGKKVPNRLEVPQTRVIRGGGEEWIENGLIGGGDKSDEPPSNKSVSQKKRSKKSNRATKRNDPASRKLDQKIDDTVIPTKKYKEKDGALELAKDIPVDLSDDVKAQIERENLLDRNGSGLDPYHYGGTKDVGSTEFMSGGAIVVDPKYQGVHLDEQGNLSDVDFEHRVKQILTENGVEFMREVTLVKNKCLPDKQKEFQEIFVDMDSLTLQRPDVLKKRILGLTSYFRSAQESLLPRFILSTNPLNTQFHIEYVEMSEHQFVDYAEERSAEMKREKNTKNKAKANNELLKTSGSYRTFTRAKCNFSFPDDLKRPLPPGFSEENPVRAEELDNIRDDNELDIGDDGESVVVALDYEKRIEHALSELKSNKDRYLTPDALKTYSPKFLRILENLSNKENRGLHLIYSSFRTLEGIGILKLVLEANGFAEFKLKKSGDTWSIAESEGGSEKPRFVLYTGTETQEEKEIIRNIYNSNWEFVPANLTAELQKIHANNYFGEVIKTIMITSSGAEGINLENTRFVHIVEPYWHMVRVDQVVGRARRICSHKNLPEDMRTIQVFLYMSKFSESQKTDGKNVGIMNRDTSRLTKAPKGAKLGATAITTDETLFEIAVIKDRLTKQLLRSVKESSIDCSVYDNSKEGLVCYTYGHAKSNEFGAFPSYEDDRAVREGTDVREKTVKIAPLTIDKKKYAHNTETDELYDYAKYKNGQQVVIVGKVEFNNGEPVFVEK